MEVKLMNTNAAALPLRSIDVLPSQKRADGISEKRPTSPRIQITVRPRNQPEEDAVSACTLHHRMDKPKRKRGSRPRLSGPGKTEPHRISP